MRPLSVPTFPAPGQAEHLEFGTTQAFDSVVVHYVAPGSDCQNYGPIFLADNMIVTPAADASGQPSHTAERRVSVQLHQ